jgi:uncharacterized protein YbjT (DUF2867 family)
MSETTKILVLGATGNTGGALTRLLQAKDARVRSAARGDIASSSDHVRFDWSDAESFGPALAGVERLYLVAPVGVAEPIALVKPFLEQALEGGLRRAVLLSSSAVNPGDPGLGQIDRFVRSAMPEWATLRPSWFMQNFVGNHPLAEGIRSRGEIVTATGNGRIPFIDARDIARSAAALLETNEPVHSDYVLTGPEALSYGDAAALVGEAVGRPIRHVDVSARVLAARMIASGLDSDFAHGLAALDNDIRAGRQANVTDTVVRLTGSAPRRFRDFLAEHQHLLTR